MAYLVENFNSWNETQAQLRASMDLNDEKIRCLPYQGLGHALTDLLYGLKEFWPMRKNLALSSYGSPLLKEAVRGFVREGATVFSMTVPRKQTIDDWLSQLPKDLLGVILVRDHCLSGEILVSDEEIAKLNEKRIPFVEIQYGWSFSRAQSPLPFGAQVRVIDSTKVAVLIGTRFKVMSHSAALMNWTDLHWEPSIRSAQDHSREHRDVIEKFEANLQAQQPLIRCFHSPSQSRLYDRTVLHLDGINGDFFLDELLKYLKQPPMRPAGFESRCETTNLSRWQGPMPWTWWGEHPLQESEQRSLIVLSATFVKEQLSAEIVNNVYLHCHERLNKNWEKVS